MKREFFLHFSFWFSFFVLISLTNKFFNLSYWPFWLGGIIGTILPDVDHLIYVFFLQPQDLTSQRVSYEISKGEWKKSLGLLYLTRSERMGLIFHTVTFQLIFLVLTFLVMSSSSSLFGKGLVLAFSLHLLIDQIVDLTELESFENWQKNLPFRMEISKAKLYWLVVLIVTILIGLFI